MERGFGRDDSGIRGEGRFAFRLFCGLQRFARACKVEFKRLHGFSLLSTSQTLGSPSQRNKRCCPARRISWGLWIWRASAVPETSKTQRARSTRLAGPEASPSPSHARPVIMAEGFRFRRG